MGRYDVVVVCCECIAGCVVVVGRWMSVLYISGRCGRASQGLGAGLPREGSPG